MNILLFTPTALASAIGRVSRLVCEALVAQGHEVVVVAAQAAELLDAPAHRFPGPVIAWSDGAVRSEAAKADLVVYQVGDNLQFHRGCLEWLPDLPGLVCLHDNFLGHLFWGWSEVVGRPAALQALESLYGAEVAHRFFDHTSSESFIAYAAEAAPLTEWVAAMASGVIVHSSWALDRIAAACAGPVEVVPLPYEAAPALPSGRQAGRGLVALTVGNVNPNKRAASVIRAIAASPQLRPRLTYRIVGAVDAPAAAELHRLAAELGVDAVLTGAVDDARLAAEIAAADIMCCLRWPALEAASASTIEAMLHGKPTVVTDTGFYADLPATCVRKVAPEREIESLTAALEELAGSPARRRELGEAARSYAAMTFRADNYAGRLAGMKQKIGRAATVAAAAQAFSRTLLRWGATGRGQVLAHLAAPLSFID